MYKYYNANPYGRNVNDCTVRAISLATGQSWDETFDMLSLFAKREKITFSEIDFINDYLSTVYQSFPLPHGVYTLKDFIDLGYSGNWLITMLNHITCVIDGVCYDTFNPLDKYIWCAYKVA